MTDTPPIQPLGELVQWALSDALRRWLEKHAGGLQWEVAARERVLSSSLTASLQPGRASHLYVEVIARQRWQSETYGYRIKLVGHRHAAATVERVI